jgi:hypothetical protein
VLVPGDWTVNRGHELLERLEGDIRHALPESTVFTHLESLDDPASWDDQALERLKGPNAENQRLEDSGRKSEFQPPATGL